MAEAFKELWSDVQAMRAELAAKLNRANGPITPTQWAAARALHATVVQAVRAMRTTSDPPHEGRQAIPPCPFCREMSPNARAFKLRTHLLKGGKGRTVDTRCLVLQATDEETVRGLDAAYIEALHAASTMTEPAFGNRYIPAAPAVTEVGLSLPTASVAPSLAAAAAAELQQKDIDAARSELDRLLSASQTLTLEIVASKRRLEALEAARMQRLCDSVHVNTAAHVHAHLFSQSSQPTDADTEEYAQMLSTTIMYRQARLQPYSPICNVPLTVDSEHHLPSPLRLPTRGNYAARGCAVDSRVSRDFVPDARDPA